MESLSLSAVVSLANLSIDQAETQGGLLKKRGWVGTGGTGNLAGRAGEGRNELFSVQEQETVVTQAVSWMAQDVSGELERTLPRKPEATTALPHSHPFLSGQRTVSPQIPVFPKQQPHSWIVESI